MSSVILALMPKGVEHPQPPALPPRSLPVILALMPKGVEHWIRYVAMTTDARVILALMPKGVEHLTSGPQASRTSASDSCLDAERR